jgi:hypothetical protein
MKAPLVRIGVLLLLGALLAAGCTWQRVQRTGYETVESMRLQRCLDELDRECDRERTRYEDYQYERERLKEQQP